MSIELMYLICGIIIMFLFMVTTMLIDKEEAGSVEKNDPAFAVLSFLAAIAWPITTVFLTIWVVMQIAYETVEFITTRK